MLLFVLFCIAVIGLTSIVVDSHISELVKNKFFNDSEGRPREDLTRLQREIKYMTNCYQCSGLWVGLILGVIVNPLDGQAFLPVLWLLYAFAGSYLGILGAALLNYLDVVKGN